VKLGHLGAVVISLA